MIKSKKLETNVAHAKLWFLAAVCALCAPLVLATENLVIKFMVSSGPQRSEWNKLLNAFEKANPNIKLQQDELPQEKYKSGFYDMVKSPVDVAFWFAGAQLAKARELKLLRPLDAATSTLIAKKFTPATRKAVSYSDQTYGIPLSYYQWGFFYKKSTFAKLGLRPPSNWREFQSVAEKLKAAHMVPTQIGAKNGWPAMAWFDYLDMRINGLEFHRKLLNGALPFTDPKVLKVFETWKKMLDQGYFEESGTQLDWDEVLPYLYHDRIGMSLMGAFAATKFAPAMASDMGFFPFPQMGTPTTHFEDAPLDILVFPLSGQNPAAAATFVQFLAENDALNQFNEATQLISPRLDAPAPTSATLIEGRKLLDAATGLSFFFDRDASSKLSEAASKALVEFLTPPYDTAKVIKALDAASN